MIQILKNSLFAVMFNSSLFLMLIIGSQNYSSKSKVNLLINQTVNLPIGFIIGTSFISGSLIGSLITMNFDK